MKSMSVRLFLIFMLLSTPALAQITGLAGWNIFLDPGHSQRENMGIYNYSEAEKNLRVGLNLRDLLLSTTDIDTVYMCRTNDQKSISLSQRTDLANSLGAAWYHSIHSNAGAPGSNSTLMLWGQYYNGDEKVPNGGHAMSDIMVDILTAGMRTNTSGSIGDCSFYTWSDWCQRSGGPYLHVNRESNMPSELSEAGYHTNPRQNQLNMNAEWKRLEAYTFYWSILELFDIERPYVGICTGIITDDETKTPVNSARVHLNGHTYTTDSYDSLFNKYSGDPEQLHNGFYFFENLPDTTLPMIIESDDYYSDTVEVNIKNDFFTFQDISLTSKLPPYVVSTTPAEGDTNVPAWEDIVLNFNRRVDRASLLSNLSIVPDIDEYIYWTANDTKITIRTPDTLKFLTQYTITIPGAVTDIHGHQFDGNADGVGGDDYVLSFKTGSRDRTAPQIVSFYPVQSRPDVELLPIVSIYFDERINPLTVDESVFKFRRTSDQQDVVGTIQHYEVNKKSVVSFFPSEPLSPDSWYLVRIFPGIADAFGNEMSGYKSFSFKTRSKEQDITVIDNFDQGIASNWWNPQSSGSTRGIITERTNREENSEIVNILTSSTKSLRLSYGWDNAAGNWLIRMYLADGSPPKSVQFDDDYILQTYVFGDGSGNKFRFALDDRLPATSASNHEVSPWYTIDWIGWKLVQWDLSSDSVGTWIGDGNLDGKLRIDSIHLTYAEGALDTGVVYFDDLRLAKEGFTSIEKFTHPAAPLTNQLLNNYPNPFNPETRIGYQLKERFQSVKLVIYDLLGKEVKVLVNANQPAGSYSVIWDGKDYMGRSVASGTYIYKLSAGEFTEARQMVLVR